MEGEIFINAKSKFRRNKIKHTLDRVLVRTKNIEVLQDVDFKIQVVTSAEMKEISKYDYIIPMGMFDYNTMTIYLTETKSRYELCDTYFHEVGHLIDYILAGKDNQEFYTDSHDIQSIIKSDVDNFDYIFSRNTREYFAQAFSECIRGTNVSWDLFETRKLFSKLSVL